MPLAPPLQWEVDKVLNHCDGQYYVSWKDPAEEDCWISAKDAEGCADEVLAWLKRYSLHLKVISLSLARALSLSLSLSVSLCTSPDFSPVTVPSHPFALACACVRACVRALTNQAADFDFNIRFLAV